MSMLKVDPEFEKLIPPLSAEERVGLEAAIVRDGRATVPLVVWRGVLLDGHNRYRICEKHGLPYTTQDAPKWIKDRDDALLWIIDNQDHRRNLALIDRIALRGKRDEINCRRADASRKAGNVAGGELAGRGRPKGQPQICGRPIEPVVVNREIAKDLRCGERTVDYARKVLAHAEPEVVQAVRDGDLAISTAAAIAKLPKVRQREIAKAGPKAAREAARAEQAQRTATRRQERVEKLSKIAKGNRPLGTVARLYPVVYADPPWLYEHAESESRAIENQYPTMTLDEICAMPLSTITTPDAILFLWVTSPKLEEGMRVVREWGFTYRTCAVWDKEKIGMGYYFRQAHEMLLVATKGDMPTPPPAARPSSVLRAKRGVHSTKPDEMRTMIERMYPDLPRVELFCRTSRAGWGVWGNQS